MPTLPPDDPVIVELPVVLTQGTPRIDTSDTRMQEPPEDKPMSSEFQMTEVQAKAYVPEQVRDSSKRNLSPEVRYDWPQVHLDCEVFISAASMTSEYLNRRILMPAQTDAWISELQLQRRSFGMALDIQAALIPPSEFLPRECIAVLQTMLFEAGFGFVNLVPGWFRTRVFKVHPDLVRQVVGDVL
ncbi:CCR4-NOT transcription complex, subunit 3 [Phytophthora oleae]|uniref:CCR4-NOT transcription complex, subunit 3 n=1 Tax=Phytophthora oleae TaxID=2107226 RepID=A0ABD3F277_9STRA